MTERSVCSRLRTEGAVMDALHSHTHALIRKMGSIVTLTNEEKAALQRLPMQAQELRADQDIVREGDRPTRCCLLIEGYAYRYSMTEKGKRQIFGFHVPGEIPDLQSLHIETMDHSLGTSTRCKVGFIQHEVLHDLCARYPRLAGAFWRETLIDAAIFRKWILGLGRKQADARIAHFLCEMTTRMRAVGLFEGNTCVWPFTQMEIGDALGLSTVHVNRTLQEDMRAAGLITLTKNKLTVKDWEGLKALGEFDPTYLHQEPREAV
jgi:CRP-like cAMP-binding protein